MIEEILAWGASARRDLPWRRTRDPWAILVSELMLQQTQVARVVPRWRAFVERFRQPADCAEAGPAEVVRLWSGLGYNRRALRLHEAAVAIAERHGGQLPQQLDALLALPGVGAYTARAVLAFAYERDVGVLDTNAARVLARAFAGRRLRAAEAQALADRVVPRGSGWAWNQAIIDLGATICSARAPACVRCPVRRCCAWAVADFADPDPAIGSAGTSGRQSAFAGSDRQGRGRLVEALRHGALDANDASALAEVCGWPGDTARAERVAASLLADGLAVRTARWLSLPVA